MQFAPRVRDLGDQRLDRFDSGATYCYPGPLMKGKFRERQILEHWDDQLRVAGSLKRCHVTASLLICKLQAAPSSLHPLSAPGTIACGSP
jgi:TnpA family transposase